MSKGRQNNCCLFCLVSESIYEFSSAFRDCSNVFLWQGHLLSWQGRFWNLFEDKHNNAVIYLYIDLTPAENVSFVWCSWQDLAQHLVLLGFPTEVWKACGDLVFQDCAGLGPIWSVIDESFVRGVNRQRSWSNEIFIQKKPGLFQSVFVSGRTSLSFSWPDEAVSLPSTRWVVKR